MDLAVICDEVSALGWRLTGARVLSPDAPAARDCFREALRSADLVLISAEFARLIPALELEAAVLGGHPLVLEIPDLRGAHEPSAIEREVRRALGVPM